MEITTKQAALIVIVGNELLDQAWEACRDKRWVQERLTKAIRRLVPEASQVEARDIALEIHNALREQRLERIAQELPTKLAEELE